MVNKEIPGNSPKPRIPSTNTPRAGTTNKKPAAQQQVLSSTRVTIKLDASKPISKSISVDEIWKNAKQVSGWSKDVRKITNTSALETFESLSTGMGVDSKSWKVIEGVGFSFEKNGQKIIVRKSAYDRSGAISTIEIQKSDGRGGYKSNKEIRFDHE
jgi:hypothetical protein